ncbi:Protein FAR1-related sequence 5 [Vitis vinifera]|uniref:Protein FAR1-related sequence 5 n=1 Tax=Vitis vinifera TaxID=29760 RepID=A0A438CY94_VITVI|nr:Protein FAR1-related sequence 5 [Vitis vinifera]
MPQHEEVASNSTRGLWEEDEKFRNWEFPETGFENGVVLWYPLFILGEGYKLSKGWYELSKGGYELSKGGYELSKGGYELSKGGYELSKGGYELCKGWYELSKGGYELSKGGYELSKGGYELSNGGGYELSKGGYELSKGGYELSKGGYELSKGGYELSKGGYELCKGGYELSKGGYELSKGWYELSKGGYELSKGGYELSKGGYELSKGGYELSKGGYELSKGGYELSKGDTMDKGKEKEFIIDLNDEDFDYQYDSIVKTESDEEAILVSDKIFNDLTVEDIWKMEFSSVEEAEEFYNLFAKVTGFSVRKDDVKRDKNQNIVSRKWVCSKEGYRHRVCLENENRKREPKAVTRVGCEATFRIGFNKQMNKWVVKEFMADHNHPLVEQKNVQFLRSHRVIKNADKAQLNAMRGVGIGTSQIMDYMVQQSGGYNNVGFTKKDLYNHVDADRRVHLRDGDAEGALAYLCGKSEMDPSFYYKYNVDEDNHLANLFWADSTSKLDYSCFGDVLAFDTTYRTNAYKKPLVILVGINHHHQTIVFGSALLVDESVSTYTWVLETFLDAMNNKKPLSVITDGIKQCVKPSRGYFQTLVIDYCMFMEGTVEEFECAWNDMLEMFNLHGHKWVTDIYAKRSRWAEAYLRGHFFAGMKSTQRCESMNAYLNRFLKTRLKLFEFVKHFDRALSRIRHNEAKAEFETHHSSAVLTTKLYALEKYAGTVFTRQSFLKFRDEMKNAELFFCQYRKSWSDRSMKCTCMMFESVGFPCPHMIVVMKIEHLEEIPETCIMKRWSKLAKETVQVHHDNESQGDATNIIRYGALSSMCSRMSYFASQSEKAFKEARCEIQRLTCQMEELCKNSVEESEREDLKATKHHVRDPIIVKTKGNPGNLKDKFKNQGIVGNVRK